MRPQIDKPLGRVWLGIDIGTQSARVYAVSSDGEVVGSGAVALRSRRDGDRHEQDAHTWWPAVAAAGRAALDGVDPARVRGLATCATSGTILLVDGAGAPLTPALMYDDARAVSQAAAIDAGGAFEHRMSPSWALPKLRWLLEQRPELARGARAAHQADVVTRALVGHEVPSDSSHALKTGYDQQQEAWPQRLLDDPAPTGRRAGPAAEVLGELLPEVVRSGTRLGEVCAAAAEASSIPAGTPVYAGMSDSCAAQFAAGALREGDWNSVLGTTLVLKGMSAHRVRDRSGVLYCHRAPDGSWLPGGGSSCGAGVLSTHFPGRDLDELGRRADAFEDTDVLAYPLVSPGERFPFTAPSAEAFVVGEPAGEAEHFAALLLGVALVERLCFDYVDLLGAPTGGALTLTGGATRSRRWCQLRADVLSRPVRLVEQPEAAVGMAVLAASADGEGPSAADAMVRTREVIEPRSERAAPLTASYLRLVDELQRRGWLGAPLADHARARSRG